jgi:hypothetical protein
MESEGYEIELVSASPSIYKRIFEKLQKNFGVKEDKYEFIKAQIMTLREAEPSLSEEQVYEKIAKAYEMFTVKPKAKIEVKPKPKLEQGQHGCNSITVDSGKNFQKLYQWCVRLSTEQGEENFVWTSETLQLAQRLITTKGNLIAVVGLQGSGKTALRQALWVKLEQANKKCLCFKWGALNPELLDLNLDATDVLRRLVDVYDWFTMAKKLGVSVEKLKLFYGGELSPLEEAHLKPLILKLASREEKKDIQRTALLDAIQTKDAILIDFPDYSRLNQAQMTKDLDEFSKWWETTILADSEGVYNQNASVVIFFQKELFSGHFLFGKFDVFELVPMTPQLLIAVLKQNCGSIEPFTVETLEYLGRLSRGIIRRFKKYVKTCLEKALQHSCNTITVDYAKQWIGLEQLERDLELELLDIFPKQKELRKSSVILLQLLNERKAIPQNEIAETVFDGNKMKCSRVLEKLEAWNYIVREWESTGEAHRKIVKLREVC